MDASGERLIRSGAPTLVGLHRATVGGGNAPRTGERFAEKLAAQGRALAERGGSEPKAMLLRGKLGEQHGPALMQHDAPEDGSSAGMPAIAGLLREAAATPAPPAQPAPAFTPDHLERIAAAIAELGQGEKSCVHVDFAKTSPIAEGALIVRDVQSGALSIRITGLVPTLQSRRLSDLHGELQSKLEARLIRASVSFDPPPPSMTDTRERREG